MPTDGRHCNSVAADGAHVEKTPAVDRIATLVAKVVGFRVSKEAETSGIDFALHAETAYAEGVHGHSPRRLDES